MKKSIIGLFIFVSFMTKAQTITIDGNKTDWAAIPILSNPGSFPYVKVHVTNDSVFYMISVRDTPEERLNAGVSNYFIANIDADRSKTTGENNWVTPDSGTDYLLSNTFHFWDGNNYIWKWYPIDTFGTVLVAEGAFEKAKLLTIPEQPEAAKIPLSKNFGLGIRYKANNTDQYIPAVNWNFPERKIFSIKNRVIFELGNSNEIILSTSEAFYMPFMKDEHIDEYLDFQSGSYSIENPQHWASWAINLTSPQVYSIKLKRKCSDGGKIIFSLVNMENNEIVYTSEEIWYGASPDDFAEQSVGQLTFSSIPAGKYMLKVINNTTWDANLKIQQISLSKDLIGNAPKADTNTSFSLSNLSNTLIFKSSETCNLTVYSANGKVVYSAKQIMNTEKTLPKGAYLVHFTLNGKQVSKKLIL